MVCFSARYATHKSVSIGISIIIVGCSPRSGWRDQLNAAYGCAGTAASNGREWSFTWLSSCATSAPVHADAAIFHRRCLACIAWRRIAGDVACSVERVDPRNIAWPDSTRSNYRCRCSLSGRSMGLGQSPELDSRCSISANQCRLVSGSVSSECATAHDTNAGRRQPVRSASELRTIAC